MAEGFSFGLRREVFQAITRRHDWFDDKRMQHLSTEQVGGATFSPMSLG
jgi:phage protein U